MQTANDDMVPRMNTQPPGLADIARVFLKIGAMSYGGPAIMGIMQTEIQESASGSIRRGSSRGWRW